MPEPIACARSPMPRTISVAREGLFFSLYANDRFEVCCANQMSPDTYMRLRMHHWGVASCHWQNQFVYVESEDHNITQTMKIKGKKMTKQPRRLKKERKEEAILAYLHLPHSHSRPGAWTTINIYRYRIFEILSPQYPLS